MQVMTTCPKCNVEQWNNAKQYLSIRGDCFEWECTCASCGNNFTVKGDKF